MEIVQRVLTNRFVLAFIGGAAAAFVVDLDAFARADTPASFSWRRASLRWLQGGIGAVTAMLGVGVVAPQ